MKTGLRAWASVLGWIFGATGTLAGIAYFINGLTRPSTTVVVGLDIPAITLADNRIYDVSSVGATAKFFFSGMYGGDRVVNHLGAVAVCLVVAAAGFALAGQAHVAGDRGPLWFFSRSRYTVVLGLSVIAAGVLPQLASRVAATATLAAAGSPAGLSPVGGFNLGWIVAGLGYLAAVRATGLSAPRAPDPGLDRGPRAVPPQSILPECDIQADRSPE